MCVLFVMGEEQWKCNTTHLDKVISQFRFIISVICKYMYYVCAYVYNITFTCIVVFTLLHEIVVVSLSPVDTERSS